MARKRKSKLIVVGVPAYNEERTIAKTVIKAAMYSNRVLVVDDGSVDETALIAERLGAIVIRHPRNMGKGEALKTIFNAAMKLKPDVLVTLDADAQHDPSQITDVARPILEGLADVVVGARPTRPALMSTYRRLGQKFLDVATGVRDENGALVDSQSGFRAYSRRAIIRLEFGEWGMGVESETLKKASENGLVVRQVSVSVSYGGEFEHKLNPIVHFTDVVSAIIKSSIVKRPLRLSLIHI